MYTYKNGNYTVIIFNDGTKIRQTMDDEFIPLFAENCDIKITNKCSQNCPFCYEGCTKTGKHGKLFEYRFIDSLHPYTELALNGNDLDHPDLLKFLEFLKKKKVFANITVNQTQFINNFDLIKKLSNDKLVYGIGVSLQKANNTLITKISEIPNTVLHTINGILSENDINELANHDLKILILGYKELQRGINYKSNHIDNINVNKQYLYNNLQDILTKFKVISFDNLAIRQLEVKNLMSKKQWDEFYMGDDGTATMYIDLVKNEFAVCSTATERFPIVDNIQDMFAKVKDLSKHDTIKTL